MKPDFQRYRPMPLWQLILLASLAGGLAEIVWVSLYAAFTDLAAATIATEIAASLLPTYAAGAPGVWLGVVLHLLLSVALGYAFAYLLWRPFVQRRGMVATLAMAVMTLMTVWAVNFFSVLPVLNRGAVERAIRFGLAVGATMAWFGVTS